MNKGDLNAIKDIANSALETHLASVHEEITDLRNELKRDLSHTWLDGAGRTNVLISGV